MFNIYFYMLDFEFVSTVTNIATMNKTLQIDFNDKNIENIMDIEYLFKLRDEIQNTNSLYMVNFSNNIRRENNIHYDISRVIRETTGLKEIKEIKNIQVSISRYQKCYVLIHYEDKNGELMDGYVLKFNHAFVICNNIFNNKSLRVCSIPFIPLAINQFKNLLYDKLKIELSTIGDIIEYIKINKLYYMDSFAKSVFESFGFNTNNIRISYNKNILDLQYVIGTSGLFNNFKKYNILLLYDDMDNYGNMQQYILILQDANNNIIQNKTKQKNINQQDTINEIKNQEKLKNEEIDSEIKQLSYLMYKIGLLDFIQQFMLNKTDTEKDDLAYYLFELSKINKNIIDKICYSYAFQNQFEQALEEAAKKYKVKKNTSIPNIDENKNNMNKAVVDDKINKDVLEKINNITKIIYKKDTDKFLSLENQEDFISLTLVRYENKDYIRVNGDSALYDFMLIKESDKNKYIAILSNPINTDNSIELAKIIPLSFVSKTVKKNIFNFK